jgi:hypothetical protein
VIWPGGALEVPVLVDLEQDRVKGTEAGPYDFQEKDGGVAVREGIPWFVLAAAVLAVMIVYWAYARSRKEHA